MKKKIIYNNEETNYSVSSDGKIFNDKKGKELKGTISGHDYHIVQLAIDGKTKSFMVHRLVAEAFCENPNNYNIVDHIDRNKLNNNYTNLRWVTSKENALNVTPKLNKRVGQKYTKEDLLNEEWKSIDLENQYLINKKGEIINTKTSRYMIGSIREGYKRVRIKDKFYSVHRLVWESFNGKISKDKVIDHINGIRNDNRLENLRVVSQSENMDNAQANGHKGQISVKQYNKQGIFIKEYPSMQKAADEIGVTQAAIKSAANRYGSCGGYFWIRDDQNITIKELLKITKTGKPKSNYFGVTQYSQEGNLIKHYDSLKEAAREIGCSDSTIKRAADAKRLGKGFYWILDNQKITINDIKP